MTCSSRLSNCIPTLRCLAKMQKRNITKLGFGWDWEDVRSMAPGTSRTDIQDRVNNVEITRLDKHGDDGIVQTTNTVQWAHGILDVFLV